MTGAELFNYYRKHGVIRVAPNPCKPKKLRQSKLLINWLFENQFAQGRGNVWVRPKPGCP